MIQMNVPEAEVLMKNEEDPTGIGCPGQPLHDRACIQAPAEERWAHTRGRRACGLDDAPGTLDGDSVLARATGRHGVPPLQRLRFDSPPPFRNVDIQGDQWRRPGEESQLVRRRTA